MNPTGAGRSLGRWALPLGAAAGLVGCAGLLARGLDGVYRGSLVHSPLSHILHFRGEGLYGEHWALLLGDEGRDLHVMITLAVCNPADTSYLSETTAAYLSFACRHRGSGWQLLDRYPLHRFHASGEHGEVRLGPAEDPRCLFKESTRDGSTRVEVAGELERETFLANAYPGPLKDISWSFRLRFEGYWYPDAWIDQLRGVGRQPGASGTSIFCRAAEIRGGLKINDSFFEFGPERSPSARAFMLHRWGVVPAGTGLSLACAAGSVDAPAAFFACVFPAGLEARRARSADPLSLLLYLHDGERASALRNNPLRRGLLAAESAAPPSGGSDPGMSRITARGRAGLTRWRLEVKPDEAGALRLIFPGPTGHCIHQFWSPCSRLVLLREPRSRLRPGAGAGEVLELPCAVIEERAAGDWWDQVADLIEIPIDLNTF